MKENTGGKLTRDLGIGIVLYAALCEAVSVMILGFDRYFLIGLLIGTAVTLLNFRILVTTVGQYMKNSRVRTTALYVIRLAIFFIAGILCMRISTNSIIAYGIMIVGVVPAAVFGMLKGGHLK